MKKFLYQFMVTLMAISSFALVSCSDDDNDDGLSSDIVGTWKVDFLDSILNEQYIQFRSDGQFIEVFIDKFMVDSEDEIEITRGQWKCTGNTLTLIPNSDYYITSTSEIIKLTDTDLMLSTLGISTSYKRVDDSEIEKYLK